MPLPSGVDRCSSNFGTAELGAGMLKALWGSQHKHRGTGTGSSPPRGRRGSVLPWEQPEQYATRTAVAGERRVSLFGSFMASKVPRKKTDAAVLPTAWEKHRARQELGQPMPLANSDGHFAAREAAQLEVAELRWRLGEATASLQAMQVTTMATMSPMVTTTMLITLI